MDAASDALAVVSEDKVVTVSRRLAERLGVDASTLYGLSISTLKKHEVPDVASGQGRWTCLNDDGPTMLWRLQPSPELDGPSARSSGDHGASADGRSDESSNESGPSGPLGRRRQANLYADVSLRLATASGSDLDKAIEEILRALAVAEGADRAYVIEFHDQTDAVAAQNVAKRGGLATNTGAENAGAEIENAVAATTTTEMATAQPAIRWISCTHEWCAEGIEAQIDYVQNLSTADFPWSFGTLLDRRVVYLPDLSVAPPEAEPERRSFEKYGVQSVLQVPMMMDGEVTGLVGFNSVTGTAAWPDETIRFLRGVCDAVATALTRVRARRAVEEAREEAEAANMAKSSFLSRMSHELRTPLNAVMGFTELMMTDEGRSAEDLESLQVVYSSGEHLLALVEDVLDISRVEAGGLSVELIAVSIPAQVQSALRMIEVSGVRNQIPIHVSRGDLELVGSTLPGTDADGLGIGGPGVGGSGVGGSGVGGSGVGGPESAVAIADPQRLQQVLVNLLSNACKYNRPGGAVYVSWKRVEDFWTIMVADSGPGIAPEAMTRIFEPFDRLGHEHSSIDGTGIGLTLTKMLVELMGGTIEVDSTVGQGTVVTVQLNR